MGLVEVGQALPMDVQTNRFFEHGRFVFVRPKLCRQSGDPELLCRFHAVAPVDQIIGALVQDDRWDGGPGLEGSDDVIDMKLIQQLSRVQPFIDDYLVEEKELCFGHGDSFLVQQNYR